MVSQKNPVHFPSNWLWCEAGVWEDAHTSRVMQFHTSFSIFKIYIIIYYTIGLGEEISRKVFEENIYKR